MNLEIPGGLIAIVKRMIACDPKDRYQNADDVVRDIEEFEKSGWLAGAGKPAGGRARMKIGAAAAVVAVAAVAGYFVFRPAPAPDARVAADAGRSSQPANVPPPAAEQHSAREAAPEVSGPGNAAHTSSPRRVRASGAQSAPDQAQEPPAVKTDEAAADNGADPPVNLALDVEPKVISRAEPDYPQSQKNGGVTGDVRLLVLVDRDGKVQKVRVQSYDSEAFINPAIEAARQCVFSPALAGKAKVRAWAPLRIRFGARAD
jgi:TonB family protein